MALVKQTKDLTLAQLASYLDETYGVKVVESTIWRLLDRHGMTYKKMAHAAEQQRSDVLCRRQAWFDAQIALEPKPLVFIDETGASTKMARRYGRALCSERCGVSVPHGHWKTTTFVGALRLEDMTAPMILDGAMHNAIAEAIEMFTPTECANYFAAAGYDRE